MRTPTPAHSPRWHPYHTSPGMRTSTPRTRQASPPSSHLDAAFPRLSLEPAFEIEEAFARPVVVGSAGTAERVGSGTERLESSSSTLDFEPRQPGEGEVVDEERGCSSRVDADAPVDLDPMRSDDRHAAPNAESSATVPGVPGPTPDAVLQMFGAAYLAIMMKAQPGYNTGDAPMGTAPSLPPPTAPPGQMASSSATVSGVSTASTTRPTSEDAAPQDHAAHQTTSAHCPHPRSTPPEVQPSQRTHEECGREPEPEPEWGLARTPTLPPTSPSSPGTTSSNSSSSNGGGTPSSYAPSDDDPHDPRDLEYKYDHPPYPAHDPEGYDGEDANPIRISTPSNDTPAEIIDLVTDSDDEDEGEDSWAAGFEDGPGRAAAHQLGREACVQILEYRTHTSIYRLLRGQTLPTPTPSTSKRESKPKPHRIGDTGEYADVTTHFKIPPHLTVAVKEFDSWATEFFKRGQGSSMVLQAAFGVFEGDEDEDMDMVEVQSVSPAQEGDEARRRGMDRRREVAQAQTRRRSLAGHGSQSLPQSESQSVAHHPTRPHPRTRDRSSSPRRHERSRHDRNRHERRGHGHERARPSTSTATPTSTRDNRRGGRAHGHPQPSSYTASASSSHGRL